MVIPVTATTTTIFSQAPLHVGAACESTSCLSKTRGLVVFASTPAPAYMRTGDGQLRPEDLHSLLLALAYIAVTALFPTLKPQFDLRLLKFLLYIRPESRIRVSCDKAPLTLMGFKSSKLSSTVQRVLRFSGSNLEWQPTGVTSCRAWRATTATASTATSTSS